MDTSKDIRERFDKPIEDLIFDRIGVETFKDSIIQVFKEYIEEKSSKSKMIGRLAFTQELLEGLEKEGHE